MKLSNISRLMLALIAILMATTAHADVDFKINDVHLFETERGREVTVQVKAKLSTTPFDIWEVNLTYPEGLTPVGVYKSYCMYFGTVDQNGQYDDYEALLMANEDFTRIVGCTLGSIGYYRVQNDEGEMVYEPYGSLKWADDDYYSYHSYYDELFNIKFYVDPSFTGGEIQVSGKASCGYDTRFSISNFMPDTTIDPNQADVNCDGEINISDASYLLSYLIGLDSIISGGDVHQDGNIDLLDYEEMVDYLLFGEWFTGHQLYTGQSNSTNVDVYYPPVNEPTEASFYIDDLELSADDLGTEIIIPVGAHFGNYISSWDVQFIFPEGLTPVYATKGSDMTMRFYNEDEDETTQTANWVFNDEYTHFVSMPTYCGYQAPEAEDDPYEPYGTVKWAAGDYDEMFLIYCEVSQEFNGGYIEIITNASSGYDIRNDSMIFESIYNESHSGDEYLILPGDINLDGMINISDIFTYAYYLVNPSSSEAYGGIGAMDMNHDGACDILDVDALCDYLIHNELYAGYALSQDQTEATFTVHYPDYTGDVNGDGVITIKDVTDLIDMLLNLEYIEYNEFIDMNGDGFISIVDVTALIDKLLNEQ